MDCRCARIVSCTKRIKGDKCECSNSKGISLLSVVGKLFGRVLIKMNVQSGRSNMGLGRVEDAWTKCFP